MNLLDIVTIYHSVEVITPYDLMALSGLHTLS